MVPRRSLNGRGIYRDKQKTNHMGETRNTISMALFSLALALVLAGCGAEEAAERERAEYAGKLEKLKGVVDLQAADLAKEDKAYLAIVIEMREFLQEKDGYNSDSFKVRERLDAIELEMNNVNLANDVRAELKQKMAKVEEEGAAVKEQIAAVDKVIAGYRKRASDKMDEIVELRRVLRKAEAALEKAKAAAPEGTKFPE